jgi:hypothetical protein
MNLSSLLKESRSKHRLKSYDDALKQLRVFRAVIPTTSKKSGSFVNTSRSTASFSGAQKPL